jgi:PKD repeat protein
MKKTVPFYTLLLLAAGWLGWQPAAAQSHRPVEQCATMEQDSIRRRKYPALGGLDDLEKAIQERMVEMEMRKRSGRTTATVLTIPIIVHIVHNGEPVGSGRNLSVAQVQSQIDVLNEDFRRNNPDRDRTAPAFASVAADIEIDFCLAAVDRSGNPMPERGIHRVRGSRASWTRDQIEGELKPNTIWDPNRYYNIWVLDFAAADDRLVGYAQFPDNSNLPGLPTNAGSASTDGVVLRYTSFGSAAKGNFSVLQAPYNQGRTLTHETGHWLGLRHIWGDGPCGNDFCGDTPTQESESRGCVPGRVSCGNTNMVQNYMDYSDDQCMNLFTLCQKNRMRAVMDISPRRRELANSQACGTQVVSVPIPEFRADRRVVLRGATVRFTDLSRNFPTSWQWTFQGGVPSTSTAQNPEVRYDSAGKFTVTLVVSNRVGASPPLVRTEYIEVVDAGLCGTLSNFNGTPSVLRLPPPARGFAAGHNSLKHRAKSEYFDNSLGYTNLSGASIRFGYAYARGGTTTESTVTVLVWGARGFQGAPAPVLERKEVPLRTILQDVANGVPTEVTFDRNVPTGGFGFHVGVELKYEGDSVAIVTTRDGEWTRGTAWEQDSTGRWERYTIARGQNVAHAIFPVVGMKSSVQVATSSVVVDAGETVTLNARGASVFTWQSPNNDLSNTLGPQVSVQPTQTTTYTVTGGGDLCNQSARVTVYVRNPTALSPEVLDRQLSLYPNPGPGVFVLDVANNLTGAVEIGVYNAVGRQLSRTREVKTGEAFRKTLDLSTLPGGVYFVEFTLGELKVRKKVVKL